MTTSLPLTKLDPTRVDHPNMFARFKHSSLLIQSQKDLYDRSLVTWKLIFSIVHRHARKVCPRTTGSREKIGTDDLPNMVAALQTTGKDASTKSWVMFDTT